MHKKAAPYFSGAAFFVGLMRGGLSMGSRAWPEHAPVQRGGRQPGYRAFPAFCLRKHIWKRQKWPSVHALLMDVPEDGQIQRSVQKNVRNRFNGYGRLYGGDREGIRTLDPQLRRLLLYPAELPDLTLSVFSTDAKVHLFIVSAKYPLCKTLLFRTCRYGSTTQGRC